MKYERLTKRNGLCVAIKNCQLGCRSCDNLHCSNGIVCGTVAEAINRLAELEDKIEEGRLLELPCKVGDEVYIVAKQGLDIYAVEKVIVCDLWYSPTDNLLYPMTADECHLSEIFPTKPEAEAKLKELR